MSEEKRPILICMADDKAIQEHSEKCRKYYKEKAFRKAYLLGYGAAMDDMKTYGYDNCEVFHDDWLLIWTSIVPDGTWEKPVYMDDWAKDYGICDATQQHEGRLK